MKSFDVVSKMYEEQFIKEGDKPSGFFWVRDYDTVTRFYQLSRIVREQFIFSALDFGCGSGEFIKVLQPLGLGKYTGVEVCKSMREAAEHKFPYMFYKFVETIPVEKFDYAFVSGTFNLRGSVPEQEWGDWVEDVVKTLWDRVTKGLAMNFLTYRPDWIDAELWYPKSPEQIIKWIDKPKSTAVVENYGMRAEWTLLVEK